MGSEVLLYGYGAVCICMLIFNIVYNLILSRKDRRFVKRVEHFSNVIEQQILEIQKNRTIDEKHQKNLERKLVYLSNLVAFTQVMERLLEENKAESAKQYYEQIQPVVLHLAIRYEKRNNMQAAYFAYFVSVYSKLVKQLQESLQQMLVRYMMKDSLYCRINGLQALYNYGSEEKIVEAIALLDVQGSFMHEKILTDGLLSFSGDSDHLITLLWKKFPQFSDKTRVSILNYIRFKTSHYQREMLKIMENLEADKELRLAAIRYFDRYPYEPARAGLLDFASSRNLAEWEYTAISVTALAKYQGKEVENVLMDCLHSSNWYIRSNAATSLEAHDMGYSDLIEIVGGKDRYAREMMMYRLENRRLEEGIK